MVKRNPQKRHADDMRGTLILWHHWLKFRKFRMQKPWMWAQPILTPKPRPGKRIKIDRFGPQYRHRRNMGGISLRVINACPFPK